LGFFGLGGAYVGWHTDSSGCERCNRGLNAVAVLRHVFQDLNFYHRQQKRQFMNSIVYIVGLVVIVLAVLSFFGLR